MTFDRQRTRNRVEDYSQIIKSIQNDFGSILTKNLYPVFESMHKNTERCSAVTEILKQLPEFQELLAENSALHKIIDNLEKKIKLLTKDTEAIKLEVKEKADINANNNNNIQAFLNSIDSDIKKMTKCENILETMSSQSNDSDDTNTNESEISLEETETNILDKHQMFMQEECKKNMQDTADKHLLDENKEVIEQEEDELEAEQEEEEEVEQEEEEEVEQEEEEEVEQEEEEEEVEQEEDEEEVEQEEDEEEDEQEQEEEEVDEEEVEEEVDEEEVDEEEVEQEQHEQEQHEQEQHEQEQQEEEDQEVEQEEEEEGDTDNESIPSNPHFVPIESEDEEELYLIELEVDGVNTKYFTSDETCGEIYEYISEDEIGEQVGNFVDGEVEFI